MKIEQSNRYRSSRRWLLSMMGLSFIFLLSSCVKLIRPALDWYSTESATPEISHEVEQQKKRVTMSAVNMPVSAMVRYLAESDINVVCESGMIDKAVTLEARDMLVEDFLSAVSRQLGTEYMWSGSYYYLGRARPEDRNYSIVRFRGLTKDELQKIAGFFLSPQGQVQVLDTGWMVVVDKVDVVSRLVKFASSVSSMSSNVWACQMYIVSISNSLRSELSRDGSGSVLRLDWMAGSKATGNLIIQSLLNPSVSMNGYRLHSSPFLLLMDGRQTELHVGQTVPIPRKTVSDQGTITTTGYDTIKTGLEISLLLQQDPSGGAVVSLKFSKSQIDGYVEEAPITSESTLTTMTPIQSGSVYLLGALDTADRGRTASLNISAGKLLATHDDATYQVWLSAVRVSGSGVKAVPSFFEVGRSVPATKPSAAAGGP